MLWLDYRWGKRGNGRHFKVWKILSTQRLNSSKQEKSAHCFFSSVATLHWQWPSAANTTSTLITRSSSQRWGRWFKLEVTISYHSNILYQMMNMIPTREALALPINWIWKCENSRLPEKRNCWTTSQRFSTLALPVRQGASKQPKNIKRQGGF